LGCLRPEGAAQQAQPLQLARAALERRAGRATRRDYGSDRYDAVLYTHDHADQAHGIDDLRAFVLTHRKRVPVWMDAPTRRTLTRRFDYCFRSEGLYAAILDDAGELRAGDQIAIDGPGGVIEALPLIQDHGGSVSLAFRFGQAAYSNDLVGMPPETIEALAGLDLWIVDALRLKPHPTHAHLAQTLEWVDQLRPRRTILTNMHIDLDYRSLVETLPNGVEPGFDGIFIDLANPSQSP
jgi:phosphoribosyl 1,2-cyclic phosphate phosphodiesterase